MTTIKKYYRENSLRTNVNFEMSCDKFSCVNNRTHQIKFTKKRDIALCSEHYEELLFNHELRINSVWNLRLNKDIGNITLEEIVEIHNCKELKL